MSKVQGDIGVRIGLSEEELERGIARVAESLNNLAKTVEQIGKRIDQAMEQAGAGAQVAAKATKELAKEHKDSAKAAEQHADAQRRLTDEQKKGTDAAKNQKKALEGMKQGLGQLSAAAGVAAAAMAALAKVSSDAYSQLQSAYLGLDAVAERTIGNTQAARQAAEELSSDGLMSIAEASKALQNLLSVNFTLEESINLLKALKDAAAFNRQAALEFGEAVVSATEGIKNGNSVLVDNAGLTKNLSMILQEAGRSAQDLQKVQSDAAVRQALYNGILKEAEIFAGNAAKAADTLAGAQARANTEAFNARAAFGEALAPSLQALSEVSADVLGKIADFVETNPELVRTAFLVVGGITAVTAAVGGLSVALLALNTAIGPAGWLILGISAATGAFAGLGAAIAANRRAAEDQQNTVLALSDRYRELERVLHSNTASAEERARAEEELRQVKAELGALMPDIVSAWDEEGRAIELNTDKLQANTQAIRENMQARSQALVANIQAQISALQRQRDDLQRQIEMADQKLPSWQKGLFSEPSGMGFGDLTGGYFTKSKQQLQIELAEVNRELTALQRQLDELTFVGPPVPPGFNADQEDSGGGKQPSDKVASALRQLEHRLTMEQITPIEYISGLEEIKRTYKLTADQLMQIDEKIYTTRKRLTEQEIRDAEAARKAKVQEALKLLDHERNMGTLSTQEEIQRLNKILEAYELTADERMQIEERLYNAQRQLTQESEGARKAQVDQALRELEHQKAMGWLSPEDEAKRLGEILRTYELTQEERWSIEERLNRAVKEFIADEEEARKKAAEEAAKAEEERVRSAIALINHRKAMGELALDDEIAALEEHLEREKAYYEQHIDELWAIEERLYRLREQARQEELAKMRQMAEEQKRFLQAVAEADLRALREQFERQERLIERRIERLRAEKEAAEEAAQARIRALQDELDALERLWAAEDRRNRLQELRAELAEVMADTRYQVVDPETGELVWTYDRARARELEQQIAEAERDDERARIRERLQDQIQAERDRLDAIRRSYDEEIRYEQERLASLREANQRELADRQQFWNDLQSLETEQLAALADAAQEGMDAYVSVFQSTLGQLREEWAQAASAAESAAARIRAALADMRSSRSAMADMELVTPTLPASLAQSVSGGTTNATAQVNVTINGASDPQATAAAVRTASQQGTEQGLLSALVQAGQTRLRTGG